MLTKISNIKDLGVFADFSENPQTPPFSTCNIIYGPNGTGKTTISRLFSALSTGRHTEYPNLKYSIKHADGQLNEITPYTTKIRVFNSDFVSANFSQPDESMPHIIILGEDNKEIAAKIATDAAILSEMQQKSIDLGKKIEHFNKLEGSEFTNIASVISEATRGSASRNYRRPDASKAFDTLQAPAALPEDRLEQCRDIVRQQVMDRVQLPNLLGLSATGHLEPYSVSVSAIVQHSHALTIRSAQADSVRRLLENADIARWVEQGLTIHKHHGSSSCEYCGQSIPETRLSALAEHFSEDDQALKAEIESALARLYAVRSELEAISLPPSVAFYSELRPLYETTLDQAQAFIVTLGEALTAAEHTLAEKLSRRTESYEDSKRYSLADGEIFLSSISNIIKTHNEKTNNFEAARLKAQKDIEHHFLSSIQDKILKIRHAVQDLDECQRRIATGDPSNGVLGLAGLQTRIAENQSIISSAHKAGTELTKMLHGFLGRGDLCFKSGPDAYILLRRGRQAKRLSEGEKTAIAFIYFLIQLKDKNFDSNSGIVVIDDPISSLDSSSIYQAFALLKNAVRECKQCFLLTHNFDFLRLLLDWRKHLSQKETSYYMLRCVELGDERRASLLPLDLTLKIHKTEYHYLFKLLIAYKDDGTIASAYNMPNIARKFLDTFLEFLHPEESKPRKKLENILFDENKKSAIIKFINDQSHHTGRGFDPSLVAETEKNITYLLEMIADVAPTHYAGLQKEALRTK